MSEKKELLTEENYERGKKKITKLALLILIIGLLLGGSIIIYGLIKTDQIKKNNREIADKIEKDNQKRPAEDIQRDMDSVQERINTIESEINSLKAEQQKIFMEEGFGDKYYEKDTEISNKESEKKELQNQYNSYNMELYKVNSGYNDAEKEYQKSVNTISTSKYIPLYMLGGGIIVVSIIASISIYIFGKRREILAFKAQQFMPLAEEGAKKIAPIIGETKATIIEKVTPAVGNAAGTLASKITEGIKNGINNSQNNNQSSNTASETNNVTPNANTNIQDNANNETSNTSNNNS